MQQCGVLVPDKVGDWAVADLPSQSQGLLLVLSLSLLAAAACLQCWPADSGNGAPGPT